jgi:hypothetical protein
MMFGEPSLREGFDPFNPCRLGKTKASTYSFVDFDNPPVQWIRPIRGTLQDFAGYLSFSFRAVNSVLPSESVALEVMITWPNNVAWDS